MRKTINSFSLTLFILSLCPWNIIAGEIKYPYYATPAREQAILEGFGKIQSGMNTEEVKKILGEPDEVRDLYEPKIKTGKIIGFTYWYLIQRLKDSGSQDERDEKLVRVSFSLDGKVIRVDKMVMLNEQ